MPCNRIASLLAVVALLTLRQAAATAPQHIQCTSVVLPCSCSSEEQCCNSSTSNGVKHRADAEHCCCPSSAQAIFGNPPAKCMEVKKCTYDCCAAGEKLCGNSCCAAGDKCALGVCTSAPTSTPAPKPCEERSWWEIVPGHQMLSALAEFVALPATFCSAGALLPAATRRFRSQGCLSLGTSQRQAMLSDRRDEEAPVDL
eukprot:TRINITY_DN92189_c0_g1_i1.p1 TRINITY_DN92189_c0_g1~~TRINITY_DN92189_c0_g1_i1.p1  ORF type:complete len:200 (-),score=37.42 TRINITY_DN92189_c0_g1_i1:28-627(-)